MSLPSEIQKFLTRCGSRDTKPINSPTLLRQPPCEGNSSYQPPAENHLHYHPEYTTHFRTWSSRGTKLRLVVGFKAIVGIRKGDWEKKDLVGILETWWNEGTSGIPQPEAIDTIGRMDREGCVAGGVATCVKVGAESSRVETEGGFRPSIESL